MSRSPRQFPLFDLRQRSLLLFIGLCLVLSYLWVMFLAPEAKRFWCRAVCFTPILMGFLAANRLVAIDRYFAQQLVPGTLALAMRNQIFRACGVSWLFLLIACLSTQFGQAWQKDVQLLLVFSLGISFGLTLGSDIESQRSSRKACFIFLRSFSGVAWLPAFFIYLENATPALSQTLAMLLALQINLAITLFCFWPRPHSPRLLSGHHSSDTVSWRDLIKHQLYRYAVFNSKVDYSHRHFYQHCLSLMPNSFNFLLLYAVYTFAIVKHADEVSLLRLFFLASLAVIMSDQLLARDWHWRYLLRPQGNKRSVFALQLCMANLVFFGALALPLLIWKAGSKEVIDVTYIFHSLSYVLVAYLELACVLIGAVIIAGTERPLRARYYAYYTLLLGACLIYGFCYANGQMSKLNALFPSDYRYALTLLLIYGLGFVQAKKLWTPKRIRSHFIKL